MAAKRLVKEYRRLTAPDHEHRDTFRVAVCEDNLLELHFCILGQAGGVYEGGQYHGRLVFPENYPLKPPSIFMITPNGRFQPNERICLSISDYHPETWDASMKAEDVLLALCCFMQDCTPEATSTIGSIRTTDEEKILLAKQSCPWNAQQETFRTYFSDLVDEHEHQAEGNSVGELAEAGLADNECTREDSFDATHGSTALLPVLLEMGFSKEDATVALRWCHDHLPAAVELLLSNNFISSTEERKPEPSSSPDPGDQEALLAALVPLQEQLLATDPHDVAAACQVMKRLNRLARESSNKVVFTELTPLRKIVKFMRVNDDEDLLRLCCRNLVALLLGSVARRPLILQSGALEPLMAVVGGPKSRAKKYAAQVITEIVTEEPVGRIFLDKGGLKVLQHVFSNRNEDIETVIYCVWSVEMLAQKESLRPELQDPALIRPMIMSCKQHIKDPQLALRSGYAIVCLAVWGIGATILDEKGAIYYLASVMAKHDNNDKIMETCCWALSNLAFESVEIKNRIVEADCLLSCRQMKARLPDSRNVKLALDRLEAPAWIGSTPVWHAARLGQLEKVIELADSGMDINRPYSDGKNPLRIADDNGHMDVIIALAERGAALKFFVEPREGNAPLQAKRVADASTHLIALYEMASGVRPFDAAKREELVTTARSFGIPPPASPDFVDALRQKSLKVTSDLEAEISASGADLAAECFSCLEPLVDVTSSEPAEVIKLEACGHYLHTKCLIDWLTTSRATCPAATGLDTCNTPLTGAWGPQPKAPARPVRNVQTVVEQLNKTQLPSDKIYPCRVLLDLIESSTSHCQHMVEAGGLEAVIAALKQPARHVPVDLQEIGCALLCRFVLFKTDHRKILYDMGAVPVLMKAMTAPLGAKYAAHCLTEIACGPEFRQRLVGDKGVQAALAGLRNAKELGDGSHALFSLWLLELLAVMPAALSILKDLQVGPLVIDTIKHFHTADVDRRGTFVLINLATWPDIATDLIEHDCIRVLVEVGDRSDVTDAIRTNVIWALSNLVFSAVRETYQGKIKEGNLFATVASWPQIDTDQYRKHLNNVLKAASGEDDDPPDEELE